jgi:hypothetical protein
MVEVDAKGNIVQSKLLCVMPSTAQYTQCSPVVEEADPILFEAKYRVCDHCLACHSLRSLARFPPSWVPIMHPQGGMHLMLIVSLVHAHPNTNSERPCLDD